MPRSIVQEDGSQIEIPTEDELKALQTKATQADTFSAEIATLKKQKEDMENDPVNKNFSTLRGINQKLTEALKKQGKTVLDDGTVTEEKKVLSEDEIESKMKKIAREEQLATKKREVFARFGEEQRKVVEHYFNKLTAGEEVNSDNIEDYVKEAHFLADPQAVNSKQRHISVNGQPPRFAPDNSNSFGSTDAGKAIADEIFGGLSYSKKK